MAGSWNRFTGSIRPYDLVEALVLVILILSMTRPGSAAAARWSPTGSLSQARYGHTATLLPNGKVLAAGGLSTLTTSELYDQASGTWSPTGALATGRYIHTATLLPNGHVLVAGGWDYSSVRFASCEVYDPASETWSPTSSLATAREWHTATLLYSGNILVVGGQGDSGTLESTELYTTGSDPAAINLLLLE